MGGDEFIIATQHLEAYDLKRKIIGIQSTMNQWRYKPYEIGFSYGIASRSESESLDDLLKRADRNMYTMKDEIKERQIQGK